MFEVGQLVELKERYTYRNQIGIILEFIDAHGRKTKGSSTIVEVYWICDQENKHKISSWYLHELKKLT